MFFNVTIEVNVILTFQPLRAHFLHSEWINYKNNLLSYMYVTYKEISLNYEPGVDNRFSLIYITVHRAK